MTKPRFLPEKTSNQPELNFPPDDGISNLRDHKDLLSMPFWDTGSKGRRLKELVVELSSERDPSWVEITGHKGIADLYDRRIMLYIRMMLDQCRKDGREPSQTVVFAPYDYLRTIGIKRPSQKDYDAFNDSLDRLKGTMIKSNIDASFPDGSIVRGSERNSWVDSASFIEHKNARGTVRRGIRIKVSDWVYGLWLQSDANLSISREHFKISSPKEIRVYDLCRKFVGNQRVPVRMNLALFHQRMDGGQGRVSDLKKKLRSINEKGGVLGYNVMIEPHAPRTPANRIIVRLWSDIVRSIPK